MLNCKDCKHWTGMTDPDWATWGVCTFDHSKIFVFLPGSQNGVTELRTRCDFGCVHGDDLPA